MQLTDIRRTLSTVPVARERPCLDPDGRRNGDQVQAPRAAKVSGAERCRYASLGEPGDDLGARLSATYRSRLHGLVSSGSPRSSSVLRLIGADLRLRERPSGMSERGLELMHHPERRGHCYGSRGVQTYRAGRGGMVSWARRAPSSARTSISPPPPLPRISRARARPSAWVRVTALARSAPGLRTSQLPPTATQRTTRPMT